MNAPQVEWNERATKLATTLSEMASMEHESVSRKRLLGELAEQAGWLLRSHFPPVADKDWAKRAAGEIHALSRHLVGEAPWDVYDIAAILLRHAPDADGRDKERIDHLEAARNRELARSPDDGGMTLTQWIPHGHTVRAALDSAMGKTP